MSDNPLGKATDYPKYYNPELLVGIPRALNRNQLGIEEDNLPFSGADVWNAYELSWLNLKGKPQAAIGRFIFPCDSPAIVESKSLKLYLNSINHEAYENVEMVQSLIEKDLSLCAEANVYVEIELLTSQASVIEAPDGLCLDDLDVEIKQYHPAADLLSLEGEGQAFDEVVDEVLYTNLFKSNCPITNQPDWASITICYQGKRISHTGLLKYLMSYRQHNDYHENCVEAIFQAIQAKCEPNALIVEANFLRRGGLDINPIRTTEASLNYQNFPRFIRQ